MEATMLTETTAEQHPEFTATKPLSLELEDFEDSEHNTYLSQECESSAHHQQAQPMPHDSMVTVRLSEPPNLTVDTTIIEHPLIEEEQSPVTVLEDTDDLDSREESPRITMVDPNGNEVVSPSGSESLGSEGARSRRESDSSEGSQSEVDWEQLEKTEEQEPRDESSDDSTALLLARLEQENNALATNPKAGTVKNPRAGRVQSQSRPPSIQHLKRLVNGPTPAALRYSMIPAPPMTDLEFYAALVQDYTRTAQCLPTLLSKKIRSGVPPPLRGVVWQSMSGARDRLLEEQFDRLSGETSPYEGIIGKDLGRSFPGVEMFRDPEGDGQRMLGRVLKCFSLYDHKIGYCQGLGFLVGPLLMHMGDKQAFCVLVRLMEHYDLRACFLPDLSGLHVRIHQFRELLKQHIPALSNHLDELQIEPAYVSQWFLSFFAVTCPLPMLFRIYDVIFAEGASETIMRVALSLMRKNEEKIMACTEIEDVMHLLLSRGLWDCYHYDADELVNDFVSLTGVVTHESMQALEASYKSPQAADAVSVSETIGQQATRFLGRLWAASNSSTKSANLTPSPGLAAPSRPASYLRRSASKQSIASTMNSIEAGGSDSILSSSTDATTVSRDSSHTDSSSSHRQSINNLPKTNKDRNLHGQIEDLLTALSEMQRDHAILATQLQREREEREEDRVAVKGLLVNLRQTSLGAIKSSISQESLVTVKPVESVSEDEEAGEVSITPEPVRDDNELLTPPTELSPPDMSSLLDVLEDRFSAPLNNRRSSMLQSKSQLREELARSKEQLIIEVSKTQDFSRRLDEQAHEIGNLREQIKENHLHIRNAHTEKHRLEKQVHDMKARQSFHEPIIEIDNERPRASIGAAKGGLRELKLGRSNSGRGLPQPTYSKRSSSLINTNVYTLPKENDPPSLPTPAATPVEATPTPAKEGDVDSLVLELVQAKTAEAVAKQEAEEAKAKLESLRKLLGMGTPSPGGEMGHRSSPSQPNPLGLNTLMGVRRMDEAKAPAPVLAGASVVGGFWGGWGKRTTSTAEKVPAAGT